MSIFFFNESAIPEIYPLSLLYFFFFFNDTATTEIYTLSLHDALPICHQPAGGARRGGGMITAGHVLVVDDEKDRKSTRLNSSHLVISYAVSFFQKSTRLNSSHLVISYAVFCLKKKKRMLTSII